MLDIMVHLARSAGTLARPYVSGERSFSVEEKGPLDLVTEADRRIEELLRAEIEKRFPGDGFFGEEGSAQARLDGRTWVVDPIDGTANFVRRNPDWAISIGIYEGGRPQAGVIYSPVHDLMLAGGLGLGATLNGVELPRLASGRPRSGIVAVEVNSRTPSVRQAEIVEFVAGAAGMAVRCYGSSTISFMKAALGQVDAHVGFGASSWDVMAGMAIVEALGGRTYTNRPLGNLTGEFNGFAGLPDLAGEWKALVVD